MLAAACALSALCGHALDETGLLPGVRESERVRGALTHQGRLGLAVGWVAAAALLGVLGDRLLRSGRRRAVAVAVPVLALGQVVLFVVPEVLGRADAGLALA